MPKLKIMDSDALNAFASGLNPRQYSVTVTTGLIKALDDREMEAVLGHELTHIRNGDVQMMVVAVIIAGVVGFFGELLFRLFFNSSWNFGSGGSSSSSSSSSSSGGSSKGGGGAIFAVIIAVALLLTGLADVAIRQAGAVALARISGRRRLGRTDQEPRRHDLGAAQDREPRRTAKARPRR